MNMGCDSGSQKLVWQGHPSLVLLECPGKPHGIPRGCQWGSIGASYARYASYASYASYANYASYASYANYASSPASLNAMDSHGVRGFQRDSYEDPLGAS